MRSRNLFLNTMGFLMFTLIWKRNLNHAILTQLSLVTWATRLLDNLRVSLYAQLRLLSLAYTLEGFSSFFIENLLELGTSGPIKLSFFVGEIEEIIDGCPLEAGIVVIHYILISLLTGRVISNSTWSPIWTALWFSRYD